jgi:hypothetical protein
VSRQTGQAERGRCGCDAVQTRAIDHLRVGSQEVLNHATRTD